MKLEKSAKARNLVIEDEIWESLGRMSRRTGASMSWLARRALAEFLERNEPDDEYHILQEEKVKYNATRPDQSEDLR